MLTEVPRQQPGWIGDAAHGTTGDNQCHFFWNVSCTEAEASSIPPSPSAPSARPGSSAHATLEIPQRAPYLTQATDSPGPALAPSPHGGAGISLPPVLKMNFTQCISNQGTPLLTPFPLHLVTLQVTGQAHLPLLNQCRLVFVASSPAPSSLTPSPPGILLFEPPFLCPYCFLGL